jgi:hypothetical protein
MMSGIYCGDVMTIATENLACPAWYPEEVLKRAVVINLISQVFDISSYPLCFEMPSAESQSISSLT